MAGIKGARIVVLLGMCLCGRLDAKPVAFDPDEGGGEAAVTETAIAPISRLEDHAGQEIAKMPVSSSVAGGGELDVGAGGDRREWLRTLSLEDLEKLVGIYKSGGKVTDSAENDSRTLEIIGRLSADRGDAWKDDVDLDAGLQEVLAEMRWREAGAAAPPNPSAVSLDQPGTAANPPAGSPWDGGEKSGEGEKGPLFGIVIVVLFVVVMGVGLMARSS